MSNSLISTADRRPRPATSSTADPSPSTAVTATNELANSRVPKPTNSAAPSTADPRQPNASMNASVLDDIPDASLEAELKQGVVFEYLQGDFDRIPHFSQLVPNATGTTTAISVDGESELALFQREPNFRPDDTQGLGDFACRFSGFLRIPMDGTWTFFLCSNDGSRLYIDGKAIVDNDGLHYSTEKQGRATLKTGVHAITVSYFHRNGKLMEGIRVGPQLSLSWYLPGTFSILGGGARGVPREVIPDEYLLFNPLDAHTQHLLATGGDPAHEPPIPPSVAKRIKILENALEEQDSRLESMRLAFERIRGIQIFDDIRKAKPAEDREDAYTIRDTVGGDTVDGRGNEIEEQTNVNVGGPRELEDIIDAHVEEIEKLKELYFFHMALQIKVRAHAAYPQRAARKGEKQTARAQPPAVSLQDVWEEVNEQGVSVDRWPKYLAAKFGMRPK